MDHVIGAVPRASLCDRLNRLLHALRVHGLGLHNPDPIDSHNQQETKP